MGASCGNTEWSILRRSIFSRDCISAGKAGVGWGEARNPWVWKLDFCLAMAGNLLILTHFGEARQVPRWGLLPRRAYHKFQITPSRGLVLPQTLPTRWGLVYLPWSSPCSNMKRLMISTCWAQCCLIIFPEVPVDSTCFFQKKGLPGYELKRLEGIDDHIECQKRWASSFLATF